MRRALFAAACLVTLLAAPCWAEDPPVFLLQFGSPGTGDGQFSATMGGLGLDAAGNVYVADTEAGRIQKFSGGGVFLAQWGTFGSGPGEFNLPADVAVAPNGEIYVADAGNSRIQVFGPDLTFHRQWFARPTASLAINPAGQFVFARAGGGVVQVYNPDSTLVTTWSATVANYPFGFSVGPSGHVYVGTLNDVRIYDYFGQELTQWSVMAPIMPASAVAVDSDEHVYVTTAEPSVKRYTTDGTLLSTWGSGGTFPGQFATGPMPDLAVDMQNNIFVEDQKNYRIEKFAFVPTRTAHSSWGRLKALYR